MKGLVRIGVGLVLYCCFIVTSLATRQDSCNSVEQDVRMICAGTKNLDHRVLRLAIKAFYRARAMGVNLRKRVVTVIDYSLASTQKRLWVIDLVRKKILFASLVAHGKNSGEKYTTSFSNKIGSLQTSLGLFLTESTYFGRDGYSLRLDGLESGFNDNAKERLIVFHGAPYVSKEFVAAKGRLGRSWGCPAVEKPLAAPIIDTIKHGSLVFAFYGHKKWLKESEFIGG